MIKNWKEHSLHMDFPNIENARCSDIDLFYLYHDFLIIGEIKNKQGTYTEFQRKLHQQLIDKHKGGGIILYINHDKAIQKGDTMVDVSKAWVKEYYINHKWHKVNGYLTVNNAIQNIIER